MHYGNIYPLILGLFFVTIFHNATSQKAGNQKNRPYKAGELLKFRLYYGWVSGGTATVKLQKKQHKEDKLYHSILKARTTGWMDKVYYIREHYESYFLPKNGLPVTSIRDVKENKYEKYNKAHFNQQKNTLVSAKTGKMDIPNKIYDAVSIFYAMRQSVFANLRDKERKIRFNLYFDEVIYNMTVHYEGTEIIETNLGKIECMKFIPLVAKGRVFDSKDDVTIWISNDGNYIPIRGKMDLLIGSFKCDLINYENLKYPLELK